ncbi:hypothetical protein HK096_007936, partial [Nowakowskiella sp. JEL0078]
MLPNALIAAAASSIAPPLTPEPPKRFASVGAKNAPSEEKDMTPEERDKRHRNTAASARFRAKKKLREQAMERSAKEMSTMLDDLQKKVT